MDAVDTNATSASSDAAAAATSNHAGETVNRRASPANRSGRRIGTPRIRARVPPGQRRYQPVDIATGGHGPMPRGEHRTLGGARRDVEAVGAGRKHPMAWIASTWVGAGQRREGLAGANDLGVDARRSTLV
ncbi:MAG TPA: hypothetical protein VK891_04500, partial [Euzebyales bacterium]|nr:hypothetical protein [Euzebyales bacterium]